MTASVYIAAVMLPIAGIALLIAGIVNGNGTYVVEGLLLLVPFAVLDAYFIWGWRSGKAAMDRAAHHRRD